MYKVVKYFIDQKDGGHAYNAGDSFPRKGAVVSEERFAELAGSNNKQGVPLIEKIKEVKVDDPEDDVKIAPVKVGKRKKG